MKDEIKPSDFYCYLFAKFGEPNGMQNILRQDDSNNLVHWEWMLEHSRGLLQILGLNDRTEVTFLGRWDIEDLNMDQFIECIKRDFRRYGQEMSRIRKDVLEDWERFLNPYYHLRSSIEKMHDELQSLSINNENDYLQDPVVASQVGAWSENFKNVINRYTQGYSLATSLRVLIPILAESFVNMLSILLLRPEIKENERLHDDYKRRQIDVKIQSLHLDCVGFSKGVDWSSEICRSYNSVINQRNDILHGNVVWKNLLIGEVFFNGKVPIFKEYKTFWDVAVTLNLQACGYEEIKPSLEKVFSFIDYVLSCLEPPVMSSVNRLLQSREFGRNKKTKHLGVLFSDIFVTMHIPSIS